LLEAVESALQVRIASNPAARSSPVWPFLLTGQSPLDGFGAGVLEEMRLELP
jgi:hypothetical protein